MNCVAHFSKSKTILNSKSLPQMGNIDQDDRIAIPTAAGLFTCSGTHYFPRLG